MGSGANTPTACTSPSTPQDDAPSNQRRMPAGIQWVRCEGGLEGCDEGRPAHRCRATPAPILRATVARARSIPLKRTRGAPPRGALPRSGSADTTHAFTHRSEIALPAPLSRTRTPLSQRPQRFCPRVASGTRRGYRTRTPPHPSGRSGGSLSSVAGDVIVHPGAHHRRRSGDACAQRGSEGGCVRHSCECVRGMWRVNEPFEEPSGILCCVHSLWTLCLTLTLGLGLGLGYPNPTPKPNPN